MTSASFRSTSGRRPSTTNAPTSPGDATSRRLSTSASWLPAYTYAIVAGSIPIWLTLGALAYVYGREWLETASRTVGGTMLAAGVAALVVRVVIVKVS